MLALYNIVAIVTFLDKKFILPCKNLLSQLRHMIYHQSFEHQKKPHFLEYHNNLIV